MIDTLIYHQHSEDNQRQICQAYKHAPAAVQSELHRFRLT